VIIYIDSDINQTNMLMNKVLSSSTQMLTTQNSYNFAKSLKLIKIRMKSVESIKKITKVIPILIKGYEDGGCLQNETGCRQTRKGQILWIRLYLQNHQSLDLLAQKENTSRCQENSSRTHHL
jgi:hypothetical protein